METVRVCVSIIGVVVLRVRIIEQVLVLVIEPRKVLRLESVDCQRLTFWKLTKKVAYHPVLFE